MAVNKFLPKNREKSWVFIQSSREVLPQLVTSPECLVLDGKHGSGKLQSANPFNDIIKTVVSTLGIASKFVLRFDTEDPQKSTDSINLSKYFKQIQFDYVCLILDRSESEQGNHKTKAFKSIGVLRKKCTPNFKIEFNEEIKKILKNVKSKSQPKPTKQSGHKRSFDISNDNNELKGINVSGPPSKKRKFNA
eukprot:248916_1